MKLFKMRVFEDFAALFFPRYCMGCNGYLVRGEEIICTCCILELPRTNYYLEGDNPVERKLAGRLNLQHAWAFLKFRKAGIVQNLLHQLKYKDHPEIGVLFGAIFGKELKINGYAEKFDLIIPVPLHSSRMRKRGYNQSAKFAEGLSKSLSIPFNDAISIRKSSTETQTMKSRSQRWENVKDVFSASREEIAGKRILLVDDVITTGATLEACGRHLIESGCSELSIACIAEAQ